MKKRPALTMRWFGPGDPVPLAYMRQIPTLEGVVTSLGEKPPGEAWARAEVSERVSLAEAAGLGVSVIESIPVGDPIKLGDAERDAHIDAWIASLEAVAACGIKTVCYNFMPVADWLRTELEHPLPDGSTALAHDDADLPAFKERLMSGDARELPAWSGFSPDALRELEARYTATGEDGLWRNLEIFLQRVVPVAESLGVKLGVHPDDPCWPVLGLPRIITSPAALVRVCGFVESASNGVTFCTGSLGCDTRHDLPRAAAELGERITFMHARNVLVERPGKFSEVAHPASCGSQNLAAIIMSDVGAGFSGPIRPDHGRNIWGERGVPGYGLYDRALGATYIAGVLDTIS
ncbi:MAG: mannonate dehydratase [Planctomycetota bacterium]